MAKYKLSKVLALFRKFGGVRLFAAYAKLGVLGDALRSMATGFMKRKPADDVYYSYEPNVIRALQTRYFPLMQEKLAEFEGCKCEQSKPGIVWFCWLQGFELAPPIVKACYASLKRNISGKELRIIDESNRRDYVQLPEFIEQRREKGQIPPAMFADLLRLELLIKYGGTWIDATVFCSGPDYPHEYLDADLFFFQFAKPDVKGYSGISNWFITSSSQHPFLKTLRDMLYAYWTDFDCVVEYFIFHRFFDMIASARPSEVARMPYGYSPYSLTLRRHWHEPFDQVRWDKLTSRVSFHKLAHQDVGAVEGNPDNYYNRIIQGVL